MKVALIQMEIAEKNTPGNIVHGLDLLQEAAANSDIAVLPEIWTTGYSLGRIEEEAETIDGSTIAAVRKIANDHHCAVVAGSIPLRHKDGKIYNNNTANYPLQTYLQALIANTDITNSSEAIENALTNVKTLQAAQLFLTMLPILVIYPFLQKYFTKGLTIGAVKG